MGNNLTVWRDVLPKVAGVNQEGTQEAKGPWEVIGFIRLLPADKVNYEKIVICFVRRACTRTIDNILIIAHQRTGEEATRYCISPEGITSGKEGKPIEKKLDMLSRLNDFFRGIKLPEMA
uniref:Uncharacterized protein n=1 Tax=candidate division CPR3 bacterium TaxID=2268181 RepID=A0A7C5YXI4_UNCC3